MLNVRVFGPIVDVPCCFKTDGRDRRIDRAVIAITNAVPGISETAQLRVTLDAKSDNDFHDGVDQRGGGRPLQMLVNLDDCRRAGKITHLGGVAFKNKFCKEIEAKKSVLV